MSIQFIQDLKDLINTLPEDAKTGFKIIKTTVTFSKKGSKQTTKIEIQPQDFFDFISKSADQNIHRYLRDLTYETIELGIKQNKFLAETNILQMIKKITAVKTFERLSKLSQTSGASMFSTSTAKSGIFNTSTSNTVDSGAAVVVEQPKALVSSNSFFKVMTSDTAKLVAASISLFAGAALTVFLGVTGMASIALAALAAALIIISVACIVILMKNKTSEPVFTM